MENRLTYPLTFFVKPGKTLLGLDRNEAFTFVVPKPVASRLYEDNGMGASGSLAIAVTIHKEQFPAEIRWTTQDGSKPYKKGIKRSWGDGRRVMFVQFGSNPHERTQDAVRSLLADSTKRIMRGQSVRGETLFVSIHEDLRVEFEAI